MLNIAQDGNHLESDDVREKGRYNRRGDPTRVCLNSACGIEFDPFDRDEDDIQSEKYWKCPRCGSFYTVLKGNRPRVLVKNPSCELSSSHKDTALAYRDLEVDDLVDFNKEYDKIGEKTTNYFKPSEGTQRVTFKDNGMEDSIQFDGDTEPKKRVTFMVDVEGVGNDLVWSVFPPKRVPYSSASLYGQLVTCGKAWGELKDHTITLIAMGQGKKRKYTVVEASSLKKTAENGGVDIIESAIKEEETKKAELTMDTA